MKKINSLIATIILIFLLSGCTKDHPVPPVPDDKLLLAKVTGHSTYSLNPYEYDAAGNYLNNYTYNNDHLTSLKQIAFINLGTWDFQYTNLLPDRAIDNSKPGLDQGYWKFYFNDKGNIEKTGLAFKTTGQPVEYEFYDYDNRGNLISLIYGKAIDNPYWKQTYDYDNQNNLAQFKVYIPVGFKDMAGRISAVNAQSSTLSQQGKFGSNIQGRLQEIINRFLKNKDFAKTAVDGVGLNGISGADSNVVYTLWETVKITSDQKRNPFSQQANLLFYANNLNYNADWNANYMSLLKSNPVKVEWIQNPEFGKSVATSTFTYTYNKEGYPITTHEDLSDPDFLLFYGNYVQDRQIEYKRN